LNISFSPVQNNNVAKLSQSAAYGPMMANSFLNSTSLLGLFPFHSEIGLLSLKSGVFNTLKNSTTPKFTVDGEKADEEVSMTDFKNLSKSGVVIINTHGGVGNGKVLLAAQKKTQSLYQAYQKDIAVGWIMQMVVGNKNDEYLCVGPEFIKNYNEKRLTLGIVYLGACKSLQNNSMAEALLSVGFAAVLGFDEDVSFLHNVNSAWIFNKMLDGKSMLTSYYEIIAEHPKDVMVEGAVLKYKLRPDVIDVSLMPSGSANPPLNFKFENNLSGWLYEGDVRVIPTLNGIYPQEGKFMCIISTGLGAKNDSDSSIEQIFVVPGNAKKLTYKINFVSEEPMEWFNSNFDDQFEIGVANYQNEEFNLMSRGTINGSTWYPMGKGMFDGGDETAYQTGWYTMTHNIADESKGKPVRLIFHVWDKGDSLYDSALLIDDIGFIF
jgi:hypothetical protein